MSHTTESIKAILSVLEIHNKLLTDLNNQVNELEDKVVDLETKVSNINKLIDGVIGGL